jgi:hypothetical protein
MRQPQNQPRSPYSAAIKASAVRDPERIYEKPKDVMEDNRLDPEDKIEILESWAKDMELLMRAEEENMTASTQRISSRAAEKFRDIQECLRPLRKEAGT